MNSPARGGSRTGATWSLIAALVGLWPVVAFGAWVVISRFSSGGGGEFSLDPRDTTKNVTLLGVGFAVAFVAAVTAVVTGLINSRKGKAARGRAIAGMILGGVGVLVFAAMAVGFFAAGGGALVAAGTGGGKSKMTKAERITKCRINQKNIAIMLGPEMWGFDHPGAKPDDLKKLDLSPHGDLIQNDSGIAYTTDPGVLQCPSDDNPGGVDYAVEVTPEGEIKVHCINAKGVKEGHNAK